MITLTVESYNRMTYTSAQETGEYYRVDEEVRDADYRIAGFYADGEGDAEVGIYSFSVNNGEGTFRPYYGSFSTSDGINIYSNIRDREVGSRSPTYRYTGAPGSGTTMTITNTADTNDQASVVFTEASGGGYGTYSDMTGSADLSGGWCAL